MSVMIKNFAGLTYERDRPGGRRHVDACAFAGIGAGVNWNRWDLDNPILLTQWQCCFCGPYCGCRNNHVGYLFCSRLWPFVAAYPDAVAFRLFDAAWRCWSGVCRADRAAVRLAGRIGGGNSVRGYDYQSIGVPQNGAVVGGAVTASSTIEYPHDFAASWRWALFAMPVMQPTPGQLHAASWIYGVVCAGEPGGLDCR